MCLSCCVDTHLGVCVGRTVVAVVWCIDGHLMLSIVVGMTGDDGGWRGVMLVEK